MNKRLAAVSIILPNKHVSWSVFNCEILDIEPNFVKALRMLNENLATASLSTPLFLEDAKIDVAFSLYFRGQVLAVFTNRHTDIYI